VQLYCTTEISRVPGTEFCKVNGCMARRIGLMVHLRNYWKDFGGYFGVMDLDSTICVWGGGGGGGVKSTGGGVAALWCV
jgi:hypothetical protein